MLSWIPLILPFFSGLLAITPHKRLGTHVNFAILVLVMRIQFVVAFVAQAAFHAFEKNRRVAVAYLESLTVAFASLFFFLESPGLPTLLPIRISLELVSGWLFGGGRLQPTSFGVGSYNILGVGSYFNIAKYNEDHQVE